MSHLSPECAPFNIGRHRIGPNQPTYIVAEIGINHNGDFGAAKKLIDAAAAARVDAVKFQKRHLPSLYREDVLNETGKYEQHFQYMIPILKKVELAEAQMAELKAYCEHVGLAFLCTPFDLPSADFLTRLDINAFKIASADLTNTELLTHVARTGKPIILSTGMSYWREVEAAVALLRRQQVAFALLHCRSVYPVWPREVNLKMIMKLSRFGCPVGYSGHDIGITIPLVAASMGACIIEKHITLDKTMAGPDHKISLEPYELKRLVRDIRVSDQAMGKNKRFLLRGEIINRELFAKSLVADRDIAAGSRIEPHMVIVQGPGKGLPPNRRDDLIGRFAVRDIPAGDFFTEEDVGETLSPNFKNTFRTNWGLICRFYDFEKMQVYNPKVIEFHLAEKDFNFEFKPHQPCDQQLIVHAPDYMGAHLLDLCSEDETARQVSVQMIARTMDLTRRLAPFFKGRPKVIAHPGAMSLNSKLSADKLRANLTRSVAALRCEDIDLLLENLPPYPWFFGGQWKGNYFMDAGEIHDFCTANGLGLCFDTSHAALYCNAKDRQLTHFIETIRPHIRHIHFADAYGLDGEGVQIGEGDIAFDEIMPLLADYTGTWVPEIWRGHMQNGRGFLLALEKLKPFGL